MGEELRIAAVTVEEDSLHACFEDGRQVRAAFPDWLAVRSAPERDRFVVSEDGSSVRWPDLEEEISADALWYENKPENPPLYRPCRYCNERVRWDSERCDGCGRERWNDPDDTELGRELGAMERKVYQMARARSQMDGLLDKLADASLEGDPDFDAAIDADMRRMRGRETDDD